MAASRTTKSRRVGGTTSRVLVIDVGGTNVKVMGDGQTKPRKIPSGPKMTADGMVRAVKRAVKGWSYDAVSIGFPGPVRNGRPAADPVHLGTGWKGREFSKAFGRPVKVVNDAAMQALGSYTGGRMLFLGLGTGLGSAMIVDRVLVPMELAHLRYSRGRTYEDYVGRRGLESEGKKRWRRHVLNVAKAFRRALVVDSVVIGGGNAKKLKKLPKWIQLGNNRLAYVGGLRLWSETWQAVDPETPGADQGSSL